MNGNGQNSETAAYYGIPFHERELSCSMSDAEITAKVFLKMIEAINSEVDMGSKENKKEIIIESKKKRKCIIRTSSATNFEFNNLNYFTTKLEGINENLISQCKEGEALKLLRERKPDNPNYVGVANNFGEHLGDINPSDIRNKSLDFDIDHGAEVSAKIEHIFNDSEKLECIIEISKGDVEWEEYKKFLVKDQETKQIIFKANTLEKIDSEEAIFLYRKSIEILKENNKKYEKYAGPWRYQKFPINRLSLILERQKRYKECFEEIEAYEKLTDRVGLYKRGKRDFGKTKSKSNKSN